MNRFLAGLRMVVVDTPYDTLDLPITQQLFSQCAAFKIKSYQTVYPYGVLPVDAYEFISTHHFLCRERGGSYEILMCFKTITLKKCRVHLLRFPAVGLLRSSDAHTHAAVLEELLLKHDRSPEKVSYGGSWTIRPEARENPAISILFKELFIAMLVQHERTSGTSERYCYGVLKVKTDSFFANYGYVPLSDGGSLLPPFNSSALMDDPGVILRCSQFSAEAEQLAEKYQSLWERRLHIDADFVARELAQELKRKVAA
jgi:hypothetical protein